MRKKNDSFIQLSIRVFAVFALFVTVFVAPSVLAVTGATQSTATVTVSSTCTMVGAETSPHTKTMMNDSYQTEIGTTRLDTNCNDASGYSIYAVGYTGDTVGGTTLSSSALGSSYDIPTGTATTGAASGGLSQWAMKVTPVSGTYTPTISNGFDSYSEVPTNYTQVAGFGSSTDATIASSVNTTYAVYVSQAQPAGTYVGKVKYILVHPSGAAPAEIPTMQSVSTWGENILLGEEVTVRDARDGTLYTVARLCMKKENGVCTEDKLWMTQNLNLALDPNTTYTHADTDLGYTTGDASATWTPTSDIIHSNTKIVNFASGNPANSVEGWDNTTTAPRYIEGTTTGTATGDETIVYAGATKYANMAACMNTGHHTAAQCQHYMVGNYYNWTAAVAMNNSSSVSAQYAVANDSICPAGWRLPKGLTNDGGTVVQSEFNQMLSAAGIANGTDTSGGTDVGFATGGLGIMEGAPYYFGRFGYVNDTTLYYFQGRGYDWSSSASSSSNAYNLDYNGSGLWPAGNSYRGNGRSVRCVAR